MVTDSTSQTEELDLETSEDFQEDMEESSESSSSHVLQRTIVLDRFRLFFVPVPKAGCTSVLWSMATLAGLPEAGFAGSEGREVTRALAIHDLRRWPESFRFGERSEEERERILTSDEWFRFTIVRNPFRRLWSAWQSKILLAEPQFIERYSGQPWFPQRLETGDDVVAGWRDFLTALRNDPELLRADVHWAPQIDVLEYGEVSYDQVGQVEKLDDTLARVRDHLRATAGVELPEPPRTNLSTLPYTDALFSQEDVRLVAELYAEDLRSFGYDLPSGEAVGGDLPESWMKRVEAVVPAIEELRNRHERVADLQQLLKARRKDLRELDRKLTRQRKLRQEEHRRNERLTERLQEELKEIERMRSSRTWQYTAPVRNAGKRFRRFKRKLRGRR